MQANNKPELLLPAGNTEAFNAALEGGADAVYLGLKNFNARRNAPNFTDEQLFSIRRILFEKHKKLYITLNTLIKQTELPALLETLNFISSLQPDAMIIQDPGVLYIAKKYFPEITIHASTQMTVHNSTGAEFLRKQGVERVILARELTLEEIKKISERSKIELEVFIHGALCYSLSGACLFSSFIGSHSSNRGLCTQPCRRLFEGKNGSGYYFSLKDQQQTENIPELAKLGVRSFKIEGRMKSADYVYKTSNIYRRLIDGEITPAEARTELTTETGREKTGYFMSGDLGDAFTESANTGIKAGNVTNVSKNEITFRCQVESKNIQRIRIINKNGKQKSVKLKNYEVEGDLITFKGDSAGIRKGDEVFIAGYKERHFSGKLDKNIKPKLKVLDPKRKSKIIKSLKNNRKQKGKNVFLRISSLKWIRKIKFDEVDKIIAAFSLKDMETFKTDIPVIKNNIEKFIFELPLFIGENRQEDYRKAINALTKKGIKSFAVSNISQTALIPEHAKIITNENIYIFNDAALKFARKFNISGFTYPLENDIDNLMAMSDRSGIVPVYFHPDLFYSRMPVRNVKTGEEFEDDIGNEYFKQTKNSITRVKPVEPVSFLHHVNKLSKAGFGSFLIDVSGQPESKNRLNTILKRFSKSAQIQPAYNFNWKRGVK